MSEAINAENIEQILRQRLYDLSATVDTQEVSHVAEVGDGIAHIFGLKSAMAGELLEFTSSITGKTVYGLAQNLDREEVGAVLFGDVDSIKEGDACRTTGRVMDIPVGRGMLGRVVNPLGQPIDGKGSVGETHRRPIEFKAPGVIERTQRGKGMICVYVAIGQKASTVANIRETLAQHGALDYTVIVSATAADSAPLQYIAPMAGAAIGEYFMYNGEDGQPASATNPGGHVLVIYDDLSNVISITDGQIYLQSELFHQGQRPAVDVGISVSRVGGSAQTKAMKQQAGNLRLDLASYRELAGFTQFGSDLDATTQKQLTHGARMTELLKQGRFKALDVVDQVAVLYAGNKGYLDDMALEDVVPFRDGLVEFLNGAYRKLLEEFRSAKIDDRIGKELEQAISDYKDQFLASRDSGKAPVKSVADEAGE